MERGAPMKRGVWVVVGAVLVAAFASAAVAPAVGAAEADASPSADTSAENPFVAIQADHGKLEKHGSKVTLALDGVQPEAAVYDGAPSEQSGDVPVKRLMLAWDKLKLDEQPPNAALSVLDGKGKGTTSTYTLTDPKVDHGALTFTATPTDGLASNADVAPAVQDYAAAASGPVPNDFGEATLLIDPVGSQGLIQSCAATVVNRSGAVVVGVIGSVMPILPPGTVIPNNSATVVKTSAPIGCNVSIAFTTGPRTWSLTMAAVTGRRNTVSASQNVRVVPGNYGSANWKVEFTLNP